MKPTTWLDRLGGRKFAFALLVVVVATSSLWLDKLDGSQFTMLVTGAMAMFGVGNVMVERAVTARANTPPAPPMREVGPT